MINDLVPWKEKIEIYMYMYFNGYRNKIKYLTRTNVELAIFVILFRPFGFLAPPFLYYLALRVTDEDYSRKALCALHLIFTRF